MERTFWRIVLVTLLIVFIQLTLSQGRRGTSSTPTCPNVTCHNRGSINRRRCTCICLPKYYGEKCEKRVTNQSLIIGASVGSALGAILLTIIVFLVVRKTKLHSSCFRKPICNHSVNSDVTTIKSHAPGQEFVVTDGAKRLDQTDEVYESINDGYLESANQYTIMENNRNSAYGGYSTIIDESQTETKVPNMVLIEPSNTSNCVVNEKDITMGISNKVCDKTSCGNPYFTLEKSNCIKKGEDNTNADQAEEPVNISEPPPAYVDVISDSDNINPDYFVLESNNGV